MLLLLGRPSSTHEMSVYEPQDLATTRHPFYRFCILLHSTVINQWVPPQNLAISASKILDCVCQNNGRWIGVG